MLANCEPWLPGRGGRGGGRLLVCGRQLPPQSNCWPEAPLGGGVLGGAIGGVWGAFAGGGGESRRVGGGGPGGAIWGVHAPRPSIGPSQVPLTSPCTPSNHKSNLNLCSELVQPSQPC